MDIDSSRISFAGVGDLATAKAKNPGIHDLVTSAVYGANRPQQAHIDPGGRWPANMILSHFPGCEDRGTARTDEDGLETVAIWACESKCPVGTLDAEQGYRKGTAHKPYQQSVKGWKNSSDVNTFSNEGDEGYVSRYYKQVKENEMHGVPDDLAEYLHTMIAPTHLEDCKVLMVEDLATFNWSEHEDASCHGLIANTPEGGDPTSHVEEMWRVLKPGAHVLLISPEDEPTGYMGACALEDKGFEVRDAILWVREAGRLHYVPKPAQRERHAGCEHLKLRKRRQDEDAAEVDEDVMDAAEVEEEEVEEEEAGDPAWDERNMHKGNVHPTVKSKNLMIRLLADVPQDAVVVDPFMGSGSTGLACLETGHDFIGIERETDYIEIADARIRYHDRIQMKDGATIESEAPSTQPEREDGGDFMDYLDG